MPTTLINTLRSIAFICAMTLVAPAMADMKRVDIPAGELVAALEAFEAQTAVEIVYQPEQLRSFRTNGVQGVYEPSEAIRILLQGLPVELRVDPNGPMLIGLPREKPTAEASQLEEVVVTGSHIRGEEPIGSKVVKITREDIDRGGYSRVDDLLADLSQNFSGVSEFNGSLTDSLASGNATLGSEVQLRGLGVGTTLTLINGIRQPAGGVNGAFVDVSTIPTAAIERIEVLADGASAIYGSDAIGGVVNFILRKDYQGAETRVSLATSDGGGGDKQLAQVFGTHWSSGSVLVGYQYNRRDELAASERPLTALGGNFTSLGGRDFRVYPYASNPGTILTSTGQPAYAIPRGQDGTHLSVADLIPGFNAANTANNVWILPRQEINSAFFNASQQLSDSVALFSSGMFSTRHFTQLAGAFPVIVSVPTANPFYVNPFGGTRPVRVEYDFARDFGPQQHSGNVDDFTVTAGANVHLRHEWQLTVTASGGSEQSTSTRLNQTSRLLITRAISDTNPQTALNVFGDGSHTNPATLAGLRATSQAAGVSNVISSGLVADGPLMSLPAGTAHLAFGTDYRNETLRGSSSFTSSPTVSTSDSRHVFAGFTELSVPIVGPAAPAKDGAARVELSLAGRYEHYSDFGQTFNPKVGLNWRVLPSLKIRGTWGTSFRAPPFEQTDVALFPLNGSAAIVPDPKSLAGQSQVLIVGGNNPSLKPEKAHVWTAGLDVAPSKLPDLELSLTYFNIDYREKIGSRLDADTTLQEENVWAAIIKRNPSAAEVAAICQNPAVIFSGDCTGPFAAIIDDRFRNLAVVKVQGLDADLHGALHTRAGVVRAGIAGTYTFAYDQQVTDVAPAFSSLDRVSFPLALRLRGEVSWSLQGWSVGAAINYDGSYRNPGVAPDRVGSFTTTNLHLSYRSPAESGWLDEMQFFISAANVFNTQPPFVNQSAGYDSVNASVVGRVVSFQLVKGF